MCLGIPGTPASAAPAEEGSIKIVNKMTKTIIPATEGRKDDFREVINSRMTQAEKLTKFVKDNPGEIISAAGKAAAATAI